MCSPSFFFFNDTATTEIYTLSLHDALPISHPAGPDPTMMKSKRPRCRGAPALIFPTSPRMPGKSRIVGDVGRSEEHTSELQSHSDLVCRLLLEKKKKTSTHDAQEMKTDRRE